MRLSIVLLFGLVLRAPFVLARYAIAWTRFKVSKWRCAIRYGIYMARQKRAQEAERIDRLRNPHRYCTRPDLN